LSERIIVAAEMMTAAYTDDLRLIAPELRTNTVGLVLAVKALNHPRIDRSEGGYRRCGILAGPSQLAILISKSVDRAKPSKEIWTTRCLASGVKRSCPSRSAHQDRSGISRRLNSGPFGTMGVGLPFAVGGKAQKPAQVICVHGEWPGTKVGIDWRLSSKFSCRRRVAGRQAQT